MLIRGFLVLLAMVMCSVQAVEAAPGSVFPLERDTYVIGERVPLALDGEQEGEVELSATGPGGTTLSLYAGEEGPVVLDTGRLAAGEYELNIGGEPAGTLRLVSPLRRSAAALTDEAVPSLRLSRKVRRDPAKVAKARAEWRDRVERGLRETGINAVFDMSAGDKGHDGRLDLLARTGTMMFANPYTRPMSFIPARVYEPEMRAFCQRLQLSAQANGRYPAFGGFCLTWDPTGFMGRRMLLVYWGWGSKTEELRGYINRSEEAVREEFRRETGLEPVGLKEYIRYLLSIDRPEFAPAIDLPTRRWLDRMARHVDPLAEQEREALARRIDAWARYLMGVYRQSFRRQMAAVEEVAPSMAHTASVNADHNPVREGQYTPWAYEPLDFRYMTAWNDQVAGPDYAYQWLFSAGMLNVNRSGEPVWLGHSLGMVHGKADYPGKFLRAAAHNLAQGGTGAGFALEGFSTVLGGMNGATQWFENPGSPALQGLHAGGRFLHRFSSLAARGRGDHGVAVLYSRHQMARQHQSQGFGTPMYRAFVTLSRLGYTPRFVTEEEVASGNFDADALVVVGQAFPLPEEVMGGIRRFGENGGEVFVDGNTSVDIPGAERIEAAVPLTSREGKPHNWGVPNLPRGGHVYLAEMWHDQLKGPISEALGSTGRAVLVPEKGIDSDVTVMQIDGGRDATYVVAVNDSMVKSHTDWHTVTERLIPAEEPEGRALYDLTDEKLLGEVGLVECELARTTARVYGLLRREVAETKLSATQEVEAGGELSVHVGFADEEGEMVRAVLPFQITVERPGGEKVLSLYRGTTREGEFAMRWSIPANAPAGEWSVEVRSQLNGRTARLLVSVRADGDELARVSHPLEDDLVVRGVPRINRLLEKLTEKNPLVLPLFGNQARGTVHEVVEEHLEGLRERAGSVELMSDPEFTTYRLAYTPTDEQLAENAKAERGMSIGRLNRTTINRNDYFTALGGFRFGRHVLLLDVVGEEDNPLAEHLAESGFLWPRVSAAFPGRGGATVQVVRSAFSPEHNAIVVQARNTDGLSRALRILAGGELPDDWLTPSVAGARDALLKQWHIQQPPEMPRPEELTSRGLTAGRESQPFAIEFTGQKPVGPEVVAERKQPERKYIDVPAVIEAKQFVPQLRRADGEGYTDAWTPGGNWKRDLRFADAILLPVEVPRPGETPIRCEGRFRYSDRVPRSQPNWEKVLRLYEEIMPLERRPLRFRVLIDGEEAGVLEKRRTETQTVPVDTPGRFGGEEPKKVEEEVVTRVSGQVQLPAGRHELILVPENVVDGRLETVRVGEMGE